MIIKEGNKDAWKERKKSIQKMEGNNERNTNKTRQERLRSIRYLLQQDVSLLKNRNLCNPEFTTIWMFRLS